MYNLHRWDGDQAASDQKHEDGEERDFEADLRLGQSLQWPSDGESGFALLFPVSSVTEQF